MNMENNKKYMVGIDPYANQANPSLWGHYVQNTNLVKDPTKTVLVPPPRKGLLEQIKSTQSIKIESYPNFELDAKKLEEYFKKWAYPDPVVSKYDNYTPQKEDIVEYKERIAKVIGVCISCKMVNIQFEDGSKDRVDFSSVTYSNKQFVSVIATLKEMQDNIDKYLDTNG